MIQRFLSSIPYFLCYASDAINISLSSGNELFAAISFEFNKFIPDLKEKTSVTRNMSIMTGPTATTWYLNGIGGSKFNKKNKTKQNKIKKSIFLFFGAAEEARGTTGQFVLR